MTWRPAVMSLPPSLPPAAVLALLFLPGALAGCGPCAEERTYVGLSYAGGLSSYDVFTLGGPLLCDRLGTGLSVGGGCFVPPGWARYAYLNAFDASVFGLTRGVTLVVWLLDEAGQWMDTQVTCGSGGLGRIDLLPGTAELAVLVFPGGGSSACGGGLAVGGTLHVHYL